MDKKSDSIPVSIPRETVNDETVKLVAWLIADGGKVKAGQPIAEIETSKAVLEIEAPASGFLSRRFKEGADVAVGEVLCFISSMKDARPPETSKADAGSAVEINGARFSDKAYALLKARKLDPARFAGKGLIRERDVLEAFGEESPVEQTNVVAKGVSFRRVALSKVKQAEVNNLTLGDQNRLASLVSLPCPMKGVETVRKKMGPGAGLAVVICEAAKLLPRYPAFNGFYADGYAHYYEVVNVGFVIDGECGLRVPIIKDADKKSVESLNREMQDLMLAYHEEKLPVEALSGGTFTITDLSAEGVVSFHPLINHNQSAILGLGAESGTDTAFSLMLTFDHRMSEGRAAARFLKDLRDRLQSYA